MTAGDDAHQADTLEIAWKYLALGYPVFLLGKKKIPRIPKTDPDGWGHANLSATRDLDVLAAMIDRYPDSWIGISFKGIAALAIDVDVGNGKVGDQTMDNLVGVNGPLPDCPTQRTRSGGRHHVMAAPKDARLAGQLGPHVDCKHNGYVCADPRLGYVWEVPLVAAADLPPIPGWVASILAKPPAQRAAAQIDDAAELEPAARFLAGYWPGQGGSDLGLGFSTCGRHEFAQALAGYVLQRGLPLVMAEALVGLAADLAGDEEASDRMRAVGDTFQRVRAGEAVTSTGVLRPVIDEEGLAELDVMLGLVRSFARVLAIRRTSEDGLLSISRFQVEWTQGR